MSKIMKSTWRLKLTYDLYGVDSHISHDQYQAGLHDTQQFIDKTAFLKFTSFVIRMGVTFARSWGYGCELKEPAREVEDSQRETMHVAFFMTDHYYAYSWIT